MWSIFVQIADLPRFPDGATPEQRLAIVDAEAEILDEFRRYHMYYNAGEIDSVVGLFTEDCVIVNSRGTYTGRVAIRENFDVLKDMKADLGSAMALTYGTNHFVRVVSPTEAWQTAYFISVNLIGGDASSAFGTYVNHFRKEDRWRVAEQRLTVHGRIAQALAEATPGLRQLEGAGQPSTALLEPRYVF
jgi:ketosteroid isomerase-like protein